MNRMTHNASSIRIRQQGLTLVEIMIAITISLLLLAGVMQILTSSKSSYNLQNGLGRLQENGRYAMDILARNIGMAGFNTNNATPISAINSANTSDNTTPNTDLDFTVANRKASDIIEITYMTATDCLGNSTGAGGTATERYFISGTDLMCRVGTTSQVIAEGVENMQILYGLDLIDDAGATDPDGVAEQYVSASTLTATDWDDIVSVRVALLVNSVDSVNGTDTGVYTLLNAPAIGPIEDNLARKVFTRTILLRN